MGFNQILSINTFFFILSICSFNFLFKSESFIDSRLYDHCSYKGPEYIQNRYIPSRNGISMKENLDLDQVKVIIRHGLRTPLDADMCFTHSETKPLIWDCNYIETFSGSVLNGFEFDQTLSFKEIFDADTKRNILSGTCRQGQLMRSAIPQLTALGEILFNTYFFENPLFDFEQLDSDPNLLYIRSTDVQRTRHSSAIVLSRLFKNIYEHSQKTLYQDLQIHLVDNEYDTMNGNSVNCPIYEQLEEEFLNSDEYKEFLNDNIDIREKIKVLQNKEYLEPFWYRSAIDCYMSLLCHQKHEYLPKELQINSEESFGLEFFEYIEKEFSFFSKWRNSKISKCLSNPFIEDFYKGFNIPSNTQDHISSKAKFSLYSAHDSTILYFLSSIDNLFDNKTPSLASMIVFETYKDLKDNTYFRVIYNGQDITHNLDGCSYSQMFIDEGVCEFNFLKIAFEKTNIF